MKQKSTTQLDVEVVKKAEAEKAVKQSEMSGAELYTRLRLGIA